MLIFLRSSHDQVYFQERWVIVNEQFIVLIKGVVASYCNKKLTFLTRLFIYPRKIEN